MKESEVRIENDSKEEETYHVRVEYKDVIVIVEHEWQEQFQHPKSSGVVRFVQIQLDLRRVRLGFSEG